MRRVVAAATRAAARSSSARYRRRSLPQYVRGRRVPPIEPSDGCFLPPHRNGRYRRRPSRERRPSVLVRNRTASTSAFLGGSAVTTATGFELLPGECATVQ